MSAHFDYKIEVFIPEEFVTILRDELARVDVGHIGNYDHCMAYSLVHGSWRPLKGSQPYDGEVSRVSEAIEAKVEVNCCETNVRSALDVIRRVHPYEEPLINVLPLANHLFVDGEGMND